MVWFFEKYCMDFSTKYSLWFVRYICTLEHVELYIYAVQWNAGINNLSKQVLINFLNIWFNVCISLYHSAWTHVRVYGWSQFTKMGSKIRSLHFEVRHTLMRVQVYRSVCNVLVLCVYKSINVLGQKVNKRVWKKGKTREATGHERRKRYQWTTTCVFVFHSLKIISMIIY